MGVDTFLIIETGKLRFGDAVCLPQSPKANAVLEAKHPPCVFYHLIWPKSVEMLGFYQVQEDLEKKPQLLSAANWSPRAKVRVRAGEGPAAVWDS